MKSTRGGGADRVRFRAGLRVLASYGLLREDERVFRSTDGRETAWAWLVMHPLTYEILRELRGAVLLEIEGKYIDFLLSPSVAPNDDYHSGMHWAWILRREPMATVNLLDGWKYVHAIDGATWVAIREYRDESGAVETYLARYEIFPHGVYKFDHRNGSRALIELAEGRELYRISRLYNAAIQADFLSEASDEQAAEMLASMSDDFLARLVYYGWNSPIRESEGETVRLLSLTPRERRVAIVHMINTWDSSFLGYYLPVRDDLD